MEIKVNHEMKLVTIWLTNTDQEDSALLESLRRQYRFYKDKKYMVAQFHSGTEDVYGLSRDLLLYNRKRLAQLETQWEKKAGSPYLSGSRSRGIQVQC